MSYYIDASGDLFFNKKEEFDKVLKQLVDGNWLMLHPDFGYQFVDESGDYQYFDDSADDNDIEPAVCETSLSIEIPDGNYRNLLNVVSGTLEMDMDIKNSRFLYFSTDGHDTVCLFDFKNKKKVTDDDFDGIENLLSNLEEIDGDALSMCFDEFEAKYEGECHGEWKENLLRDALLSLVTNQKQEKAYVPITNS